MEFRVATAVSGGLHAAVLLWALISFSSRPLEATPVDSLPVDLISDKDFSELTKGIKEPPKPVEKPKPLVQKIDEPKPVEPELKLNEKLEVKQAQEKPPPPQAKPDPIVDRLKKPDETPQQVAKNEPLPPKKPPPKPQPKFDADKIAALLDKRDPQSKAATGAELNAAPGLGSAMGTAAQLSQSEIDALRAKLMALWNPPIGMQDAEQNQVTIRIRFKRDGTLATGPQVLTSGQGTQFDAMRDSAVRAVFVAQPYTMLRPDHYDIWKEIDFTFDTRQMFHDLPAR
jgi:outer membrane biosynthesis protein TonB